MKTKILSLFFAAFYLASCTAASLPPTPGGPARGPETTPTTTSSGSGFVEPDPDTWVMLMPAVREYFYYRKQAMLAGDVEVLWARYPELRNDADISKGINAEGSMISAYLGMKLFDGNVFPESYERIKVKAGEERAEVLVHGLELYLYRQEDGSFQDSGGEVWIDLYMRRSADRQWNVYKTDAVTDAEYGQFAP